jgi:glycine betaine/choline ABC-type transport system substrate-binding protein
MKRSVILCIALVAVLAAFQLSAACVGRTVHLGIVNTNSDRLLAEMASLLIIERTGTTVQIDTYKNASELYAAVRKGNVNVLFENPVRAAEILGASKDSSYEQIKSTYRTKLNLTWLDIGPTKYAPVLTTETIVTFPAMPKLLNKLSKALENDAYNKMVKSAESGDKAKKVAKDFLKGKKLI